MYRLFSCLAKQTALASRLRLSSSASFSSSSSSTPSNVPSSHSSHSSSDFRSYKHLGAVGLALTAAGAAAAYTLAQRQEEEDSDRLSTATLRTAATQLLFGRALTTKVHAQSPSLTTVQRGWLSETGISEKQINELIDRAFAVKRNSWSPYSNFRVGVAVLGDNGRMYSGTNVENASYGLCICAERVAICNAVSDGVKEIKAVVVSTDIDDYKWCCGACLSFILEFGEEVPVFSVRPNRSFVMKRIREQAPVAFSRADLMKPRVAHD